jgi:leucyl-tRNA synthetase
MKLPRNGRYDDERRVYMDYKFSEIEKKWQDIWEKEGAFKAKNDFTKPKFYGLIEFPYPSGNGLHVGHPKSNTAIDIISRKRRMEGYNVLYPIGWDAFGLPTENYAIKNKIHPSIVTKQNVDHFREQLKKIGFSFDWDREINTTDPSYYKWTQWIFLQMYKHGLAYKAEIPINFCTSCKVGLANEEVVNGVCERCGGEVVQKVKSQWMLKITEYAERLYDDLDETDFIDKVKIQQRNWIGKSKGAEVKFKVAGTDEELVVFTTRPDTLFGATYMVVSPEHKILEKLNIENIDEVKAYQKEAAKKSEFERTEMNKDKTGVMLKGVKAINPVNGKEIPIWISDYVLASYGTGAIMAVPAHDDRDWAFAKKFNMPIIQVISGEGDVNEAPNTNTDTGVMINSGFLDGIEVKRAIDTMIKYLEEKGIGKAKTNFKLRDWVFSRQRYWGEPIPMVHCDKCGWVPLPEESLPLELPYTDSYEPTDNGESPLANLTDWVNTTCPHCGGKATRETDTMPNWAGSSWYFLRYIDPHNDKEIADKELLKYWLPVDWYNGGMEHTTLHLLYSRFWHKFLYDIGAVPTSEPYQKRTAHGMILGANGEKMSKSRGNVINPDDMIAQYGADTLRMYEMFMGAFDQAAPWSEKSVKGCYRFLERVYNLMDILVDGDEYSKDLESIMHKTIKKVSNDYEKMKFNTAIASMMELINEVYKVGKINKAELKTFITLLNPVAPHITEEMWERAGLEGRLYQTIWPECDEEKTVDSVVEVPVQVNGKLRSVIKINKGATSEEVERIALADEEVKKFIDGKEIVKKIYVPERIFTIVAK